MLPMLCWGKNEQPGLRWELIKLHLISYPLRRPAANEDRNFRFKPYAKRQE